MGVFKAPSRLSLGSRVGQRGAEPSWTRILATSGSNERRCRGCRGRRGGRAIPNRVLRRRRCHWRRAHHHCTVSSDSHVRGASANAKSVASSRAMMASAAAAAAAPRCSCPRLTRSLQLAFTFFPPLVMYKVWIFEKSRYFVLGCTWQANREIWFGLEPTGSGLNQNARCSTMQVAFLLRNPQLGNPEPGDGPPRLRSRAIRHLSIPQVMMMMILVTQVARRLTCRLLLLRAACPHEI